jgi:hypothetical protein
MLQLEGIHIWTSCDVTVLVLTLWRRQMTNCGCSLRADATHFKLCVTLLSTLFRYAAGKLSLLCSCWRNSYLNFMWRYCRYTSATAQANSKLWLLSPCWRNLYLNFMWRYCRYCSAIPQANCRCSVHAEAIHNWALKMLNEMWVSIQYSASNEQVSIE